MKAILPFVGEGGASSRAASPRRPDFTVLQIPMHLLHLEAAGAAELSEMEEGSQSGGKHELSPLLCVLMALGG